MPLTGGIFNHNPKWAAHEYPAGGGAIIGSLAELHTRIDGSE
jgi:hypothetical protein